MYNKYPKICETKNQKITLSVYMSWKVKCQVNRGCKLLEIMNQKPENWIMTNSEVLKI